MLTVIIKIVFTSPETMVEFSGEIKLKRRFSARQKPFLTYANLYSFESQGIFFLVINKIMRLQVTLDPRHAKNVIRYTF